MRRALAVTVVVTVLAIHAGAATAAWLASSAGAGSAKAGALGVPSALGSIHPNVDVDRGHVDLTWAASSTAGVTYDVVRATAAAPASTTTINSSPAPGSGVSCSGSPSICTYRDTTAVYNESYVYTVRAVRGLWQASSSNAMALSLKPSSGTDLLTNPQFRSAAALSATTVFAVSTSGKVISTTNAGATWTAQTSGVMSDLHGVAGGTSSGTTRVWAVGVGGTIVVTTNGGSTWTSQASGVTTTLFGVAAANANTAWAVGEGGVILATTNGGTTWTAQSSGLTTSLFGVAAANTNTAWAVGAGGKIVGTTNGGSTWTSQASGLTTDLNGVAAGGTTHVWAVGAGGKVLATSNGSTWSTQSSAVTTDLYGVAAIGTTGQNTVTLAVGAGGALLRRIDSSTTWTVQTSGTAGDLRAVALANKSDAWAVGANNVLRGSANASHPSGSSWSAQTSPVTASAAISAAGVGALAVGGDASTFVGSAAWSATSFPTACASQSLSFSMSATTVAGAPVTSTKVVLKYGAATTGTATTPSYRILASGDGGSTWTPYALNGASAAPIGGADVTAIVDVSEQIDTEAEVNALRLCFQATKTATGSPFTTSHDLVHVDVN